MVYAAILAIDLVGLLLVLAVLTWAGDRIEDMIWPGGSEWIDF